MTIAKDGRPILDLNDWGKRAGPKSKDHWREHRSAMEAARSWLAVASPVLPPEVQTVLDSHPEFGVVEGWDAEPEARLPFDDFPGEPRNTDLVVYARDQYGEFVLAVEAKADEPFSETVADALAAAVERKVRNPRSNGVARIEKLVTALLGPRRIKEPSLGTLRYQLLTATAGALRAGVARGLGRTVVLVQEFVTRCTDDTRHELNASDLNRFTARLSHRTVTRVEPGSLYGPFAVPGAPLFSAAPALFLGKAVCNLRSRSGSPAVDSEAASRGSRTRDIRPPRREAHANREAREG